MKLKFSRKDIVPLITTIIFFSWIALWVISIFMGWASVNLFGIFYLCLPIPWVILIIIVWVNWNNVYEKIRQPKYKRTHFNPLYIRAGLVRLFQIILIFIIFIYFIMLEINNIVLELPAGLIVVVNAILAYFGYQPSEVLPSDYVIESLRVDVPSNKQLLTSLPVVKDAVNQFEIKFKETIDTIDELVEQSKIGLNKLITTIEQRLDDLKKISSNMPAVTFSRDPFDKYNYLILVSLLAIINLVAQPVFNIPSYIALPTFSIFGVLLGISARGKINGNITNRISINVEALKEELESFKGKLDSTTEITKELQSELYLIYNAFIESNFLDFLPANYSSLLSIGFVSFLSLFIFILRLPTPEAIFTTIQWFVIYYFVTKH